MNESFVDLTYRGLQLGRRVKLTSVRPSTGYLEIPAPMPVGTAISIATDEGVVLEAVVTAVHEQVGGSDRAPGMTVRPVFSTEADPASATQAWWRSRVVLPDEELTPSRERPVTVLPRSPSTPPVVAAPSTAPASAPASAPAATLEPESSVSSTTVMPVFDERMLDAIPRDETEPVVRAAAEHAVVDDGKRTIVMDSVDPAALGLEVSASGAMAAVVDDDAGDDKKPGGAKKRRKKR